MSILEPKFCCGYNLRVARRKNEDNKCGFEGCNNTLPQKDYVYFGVKICSCHSNILEKEKIKIQRQADEEIFDYINRAIGIIYGNNNENNQIN